MKKFSLLPSILSLLTLVSCHRAEPPKPEATTPFYYSSKIRKITNSQLPCVPICIEGKTVLVEIDLGFTEMLSLRDDFIDLLKRKVYVDETKIFHVKGDFVERSIYEVPKVRIGDYSFFPVYIEEQRDEPKEYVTIYTPPDSVSEQEAGAIGWRLFKPTRVLFDFPVGKIAFCDSFATLKKLGYPVEKFVKVPLLTDRRFVEFECATPEGPIRCTLDTGATVNVINKGDKVNLDRRRDDFCFQIGKNLFGPFTAYEIPIKLPVDIQVMLGMNFFAAHIVFIDFPGKWIYFLDDREMPL